MNTIFNTEFWLAEWEKDKDTDTYAVHKGFSTPEYWDKAAQTYDRNKKEVQDRRLAKTMDGFRNADLLFDGMTVLEIGCGTGMVAMEMASLGARVTALDFSRGMLEKFDRDISPDIQKNITLVCEDWHRVNIEKKGWTKAFDLVIAFMSPGVADPESFFKMMDCAGKGCAIRGWAAKRPHLILVDLWEKIMGVALEDKPQSILYKINLLFSMGIFPEISFDPIEWDQTVSMNEEFDTQMAFFKKVSKKSASELEQIIRPYLEALSRDQHIVRKHKGLTATAVFRVDLPYL